MSLTAKKVDQIFEKLLNFHTIFVFCSGFREKIEPSQRNYLVWSGDWGGEHYTPDTQNTLIIFLSEIAVM